MRGFTLVEVLVVLLICALVAGMAVLTIHTNLNHQIKVAAKEIASLITLAEEEAMLRPATLGLSVNNNQLEFYVFRHDPESIGNQWVLISTSPLAPHPVSADIEMNLWVNGELR